MSFAEDELTPKGSRGPEPGTRPGEEEKSLPEIDSGIEVILNVIPHSLFAQ